MECRDQNGDILKHEENKPQWSVMPWDAIESVVRVFEYGANKYNEPFTYYKEGLKYSSLFESMLRHMIADYYYGEERDPDSGCLHLSHAAANALMLIAAKNRPQDDDRPKHMQEVRLTAAGFR
jgi:hypothetical protein